MARERAFGGGRDGKSGAKLALRVIWRCFIGQIRIV
jgi:hypothetical protein